jgi:CBS domain-containing protein
VPPRHAAPVRTRLTVLKDGTTESRELIFCEGELRSVPVSRCEACPFVGPKSSAAGGDGVVDCGRTLLPIGGGLTAFPPDVAATLPVGLALWGPVVCVQGDLPLVDLPRALTLARNAGGVPVVDRVGALVGILPAAEIAAGGTALDRLASVADRAVAAASVHETESLGRAFGTMGARHVREVTVIGDDLAVVGVLRDLDALRFVAYVSRTGTRPAPDRAA